MVGVDVLENSLRVLISTKTLAAVNALVAERNKVSLATRHSTSSVVREAIERLLKEQPAATRCTETEIHRGR